LPGSLYCPLFMCSGEVGYDVPHPYAYSASSHTTNCKARHHSSLADFPFGLVDARRWSRVVIESVLMRPIRQPHPSHAAGLARQPAKSLTLLRSRRCDKARTPHITTAPYRSICSLPARQLSGRATVSISLCSQPRVVYIRCIGSRRPPLIQQRSL
jgi:hypothetical protein